MKLKNLFLISAIVLLVSACSQTTSQSLISPKALGELTADLKQISKDYDIIKVDLSEKDELSGNFGFVNLDLMKDGENYSQVLYYNFGIAHNDPKKERKSGSDKDEPKSINVEDIEKQQNNIEKYLEDAKAQIAKNFEGFSFHSIRGIEFYINEDGNFEMQLSVNVIEDGKSERREMGRTVTDYYTLDFFVDGSGNVTYKD
ncbi:MAG: hypothetical protein LBP63_11030 [Prevotellaceae bacterium]|jgi:hypothetical protein|nr:hypothetical protein [Prevotellaceae bacterium]